MVLSPILQVADFRSAELISLWSYPSLVSILRTDVDATPLAVIQALNITVSVRAVGAQLNKYKSSVRPA